MFVWRAARFVDLVARYEPEMAASIRKLSDASGSTGWTALLESTYPSLKKISVDYGVMEKASADPEVRIAALPLVMEWKDIGSWPAYGELAAPDAEGNVSIGGLSAFVESAGNMAVCAEPGHLIACLGCEDLVIVHTRDATLVCPRSRAGRAEKAPRGSCADGGRPASLTPAMKRLMNWLAGIGYASIFGFSFLMTKGALDVLDPLELMFLRFSIAALALSALWGLRLIRLDFRHAHVGHLVLTCLFQPILYFLCETYGVRDSASSMAGIVIGAIPASVAILGSVMLKERLSLGQKLSLSLSIAGVALIVAFSGASGSQGGTIRGFVLLLGAVAAASLFNIYSRKTSRGLKPLETTFAMMWTGAIFFGVLNFGSKALLRTAGTTSLRASLLSRAAESLPSLLYLGLMSSVIAFFLINFHALAAQGIPVGRLHESHDARIRRSGSLDPARAFRTRPDHGRGHDRIRSVGHERADRRKKASVPIRHSKTGRGPGVPDGSGGAGCSGGTGCNRCTGSTNCSGGANCLRSPAAGSRLRWKCPSSTISTGHALTLSHPNFLSFLETLRMRRTEIIYSQIRSFDYLAGALFRKGGESVRNLLARHGEQPRQDLRSDGG